MALPLTIHTNCSSPSNKHVITSQLTAAAKNALFQALYVKGEEDA